VVMMVVMLVVVGSTKSKISAFQNTRVLPKTITHVRNVGTKDHTSNDLKYMLETFDTNHYNEERMSKKSP